MATTCKVDFQCPGCGRQYRIVGEPAAEQELLKQYFATHRTCCKCSYKFS